MCERLFSLCCHHCLVNKFLLSVTSKHWLSYKPVTFMIDAEAHGEWIDTDIRHKPPYTTQQVAAMFRKSTMRRWRQ